MPCLWKPTAWDVAACVVTASYEADLRGMPSLGSEQNSILIGIDVHKMRTHIGTTVTSEN
jgi:hypothetical protein